MVLSLVFATTCRIELLIGKHRKLIFIALYNLDYSLKLGKIWPTSSSIPLALKCSCLKNKLGQMSFNTLNIKGLKEK